MHRLNDPVEKLYEARNQGYLPSDWQTQSEAELLTRADHARRHAEADTHPPYTRQWYLTQAEYLTEASQYVRTNS